MASIEPNPTISCPYYASRFENKYDLSKHIDGFHNSSDLMRAILGHSKFSP